MGKDLDLKNRKIIKLANAENDGDAVNLGQLNDRIGSFGLEFAIASNQSELKALLSSSTPKFIQITQQFTVTGILEIANSGSIVSGVVVLFGNNLEIKNTSGSDAYVIFDCNLYGSSIALNYSTNTHLLDFYIKNTTGIITWNNTGTGSLNARICNYTKISQNTQGTGSSTIVLGDSNYWIPKNKVNELTDVDESLTTTTPNNNDAFFIRNYSTNIFQILTWSNMIDKIINYANSGFLTVSQTIKGAINEIVSNHLTNTVDLGTVSGTVTVDASSACHFTATLGGATTFNITNPKENIPFFIEILDGNSTVDITSSGVTFHYSTIFNLVPGKSSLWVLFTNSTNANWHYFNKD